MKKALIYGFLGRGNFGDELMAEIHRKMLLQLGYSVYFTTDSNYHKNIDPSYKLRKIFIYDHEDIDFDLIIYGGGALPIYTGLEYLLKFKINKPSSKIIASSVNYNIIYRNKSMSENLTKTIYDALFDNIIFRSPLDDFTSTLSCNTMFMPDIVTTLDNSSTEKNGKIAVIYRNDPFFKDNFPNIFPKPSDQT